MNKIKASEFTVRATAATLGRSALFDDKITEGDGGRLAAWAEALEPFKFDTPDLLDAVTAYYQNNNNGRTIQVSDIIRHAREIRRDRAEREKAAEVHTEAAALPAGSYAGLPIPAEGQPVWEAYDINDADTRTCPNCGAGPKDACVTRTGKAQRIPCLARMTGRSEAITRVRDAIK